MLNSNGSLPREIKPLTPKALEFCRVYVSNGGKQTDAYQEVYGQQSRELAAASASQLMKDRRILKQIEWEEDSYRVVGYKLGMTKESIVSILVGMLNATKKDSKGNEVPDWPARNNAIIAFSRLTGDMDRKERDKPQDSPQEEAGNPLDLSALTGKELIEARKKIIDKMTLGDA